MTTDFVTRLPFPGFYESELSAAVDWEAETRAEWYAELQGDVDSRDYIADPLLRIEADRIGELFSEHSDFSKAYDLVAREWVEAFDTVFATETGLHLNLRFESMSSPREYNFSTDRVFAYLDRAAALKLRAMAIADRDRLAKVVGDNFTSYSGFVSFYSDDVADLIAKDPEELDHNEWCVFIEAALFGKVKPRRVEDDIHEILTYNNTFGDAFDRAIDWPGYDKAVEEERAALLAEIRVFDPYYTPAYRCPETPDLFARAA